MCSPRTSRRRCPAALPISAVTLLAGLSWITASVAAATALRRRTQAPLSAYVLIGLSAVYFAHDLPLAPVAGLCLSAGAAWIGFTPTNTNRGEHDRTA